MKFYIELARVLTVEFYGRHGTCALPVRGCGGPRVEVDVGWRLAAQCRRLARETRGAGFCAEVRSSNATGVHEPCGQILRTFSNKMVKAGLHMDDKRGMVVSVHNIIIRTQFL